MTNNNTTIEAFQSEEFTALLDQIKALDIKGAQVFEAGALAVIGVYAESARVLADKAIRSAASIGVGEEEAREVFNSVFGPLSDLVQPGLNLLRDAVHEAQGLNDPQTLIEGLLQALIDSAEDKADEDVDEDLLVSIFGAGAR